MSSGLSWTAGKLAGNFILGTKTIRHPCTYTIIFFFVLSAAALQLVGWLQKEPQPTAVCRGAASLSLPSPEPAVRCCAGRRESWPSLPPDRR